MAERTFEESVKLIRDPRKRTWYEQAMSYGRAHDSFIEVLEGSDSLKAWLAYFSRKGWYPVGIGSKSWTAPTPWPEQLPF